MVQAVGLWESPLHPIPLACMCARVCVHMHMYVRACVRVHCVHVYACVCACVCTRMCVCVCACTHPLWDPLAWAAPVWPGVSFPLLNMGHLMGLTPAQESVWADTAKVGAGPPWPGEGLGGARTVIGPFPDSSRPSRQKAP